MVFNISEATYDPNSKHSVSKSSLRPPDRLTSPKDFTHRYSGSGRGSQIPSFSMLAPTEIPISGRFAGVYGSEYQHGVALSTGQNLTVSNKSHPIVYRASSNTVDLASKPSSLIVDQDELSHSKTSLVSSPTSDTDTPLNESLEITNVHEVIDAGLLAATVNASKRIHVERKLSITINGQLPLAPDDNSVSRRATIDVDMSKLSLSQAQESTTIKEKDPIAKHVSVKSDNMFVFDPKSGIYRSSGSIFRSPGDNLLLRRQSQSDSLSSHSCV